MEIIQIRNKRFIKFENIFNNKAIVVISEDVISSIEENLREQRKGLINELHANGTIIICNNGEKYHLKEPFVDVLHLLQDKP